MKWDKFLKQQGTDKVLEDYFAKTPTTFDGTLVRARHVLITTGGDPAKVAAAKQKLAGLKATITAEAEKVAAATPGDALAKNAARGKKADELFAEAAKATSDCPSKANGGDLQFFPRVGAMVEPFADAAFKLELFGMSEVVETDFGCHLILCTARNPGKPRTFADVKEDVRAVYALQLRQAVLAAMKPKAQIALTAPGPEVTRPPIPSPGSADPGLRRALTAAAGTAAARPTSAACRPAAAPRPRPTAPSAGA